MLGYGCGVKYLHYKCVRLWYSVGQLHYTG
jgi:hypothetical protein